MNKLKNTREALWELLAAIPAPQRGAMAERARLVDVALSQAEAMLEDLQRLASSASDLRLSEERISHRYEDER